MIRDFEYSNFNSLFVDQLRLLLTHPDHKPSPRGQLVHEVLGQTFVLNYPRARLLTIPARKTNFGFAVGEFLWYWDQSNDLERLRYYNKRAPLFSNDGKTVNSAYGKLMFENGGWDNAVKTLLKDPDSRQALVHINLPRHIEEAVQVGSKDVPCTMHLQFFVRDGKLDMHAVMRSNDIMWGLTYDLFSFTLFQEMMLLRLRSEDERFYGLKLGRYIHTAGSLHLYERHFEDARRIVKEWGEDGHTYDSCLMPPLTPDLDMLTYDSEELRKHGRPIDVLCYEPGSGEAWMATKLNEHAEKRKKEQS